jgi:type III pantothenate kinase
MQTQIAIDRGNTLTKISLAQEGSIITSQSCLDNEILGALENFVSNYEIGSGIIANVRDDFSPEQVPFLQSIKWLRMSPSLNLPFKMDYDSIETIGHDRLANIAASCILFPKENALIVDCGSCITYSLLANHLFVGGSISPGLNMRFRALQTFTGKLPLVEPIEHLPALLGKSTSGSILSGVQHAIMLEIDAMISEYRIEYANLRVILTGGNYSFFENSLKSATFACPQLTQIGLHEILRINS